MARRLILLALALAGSTGTTAAQDAPAYCAELQQIVSIAMTKGRFSDIAGKPQQGDFHATDLALPGWKDCCLYGGSTHNCTPAEADLDQKSRAHSAPNTK